ncbi:hypothetical protein F2Q70_00041259 [Brassica cretica]|uniref:Uncharacterized protein n=1 Tax=Brassica cretica TaxID=69181 RepID=A0A8S9K347_BRACR|nr:hypothetical protein F2Q70_00041259 [Brassica cretica]
MSASRKMVLINDLKPFKDEWRIRLKLLHSLKTKTDYGGESLECIFADETIFKKFDPRNCFRGMQVQMKH